MIRSLKGDRELIELLGHDATLDFLTKLMEVINKKRKRKGDDEEQTEDEGQGFLASIVSFLVEESDKCFFWIECFWRIEKLDDESSGMGIIFQNILLCDTTIEELMGSDEVLDRYNELKKDEAFKKME
jgi:hypothetical protein